MDDNDTPHASGFITAAIAGAIMWVIGVVLMAYFFGHVIK